MCYITRLCRNSLSSVSVSPKGLIWQNAQIRGPGQQRCHDASSIREHDGINWLNTTTNWICCSTYLSLLNCVNSLQGFNHRSSAHTMTSNPRVIFGKRPAPHESPKVGEHLILDKSRTIDLENVPLNGGFLTKTLILRYRTQFLRRTHELFWQSMCDLVLNLQCGNVWGIHQFLVTLRRSS